MANPTYGTFPNAYGWDGIHGEIKQALAKQRIDQAAFADKQNLNGRFDWIDRVYRGDLLTPQFLLRPILRREANTSTGNRSTPKGLNLARDGVVTEVGVISPNTSLLERVRNNAR